MLQQLGQHDFSSLGVVFWVNRGIVGGRVLRDAGNHGRFGQGEVRGVFAKIALGRGLYAVTTLSKVHGVHVGFQNLVFAHLLFDAEREHLFLQFPLQAVHERRLVQEVGKHVVLDQLLGQRAGSLAPFEAGEDGTYARPHDTLRVDAVVLVETLVLDGDECLADIVREGVNGLVHAVRVRVRKFLQQGAVRLGVDEGRESLRPHVVRGDDGGVVDDDFREIARSSDHKNHEYKKAD